MSEQGPLPGDEIPTSDGDFIRMVAINGSLHFVAIILVALRTYTRIRKTRSFGADDALLVTALLFLSGGGITTQIYAAQTGTLDHSQAEFPGSAFQMHAKLRFIQDLTVTITSMCLLKFSIGLSLLRLQSNKWCKKILWALLIFIILHMLESYITLLAFCSPISKPLPDEPLTSTICFPQRIVSIFQTVNTSLSVFTDICLASFAVPMLWRMVTGLRARMLLIIIFGVGFLAIGAGILRFIAQEVTRGSSDERYDSWVQFFELLQANLAIIATSAPPLHVLLPSPPTSSTHANIKSIPGSRYPYISRPFPIHRTPTDSLKTADFEVREVPQRDIGVTEVVRHGQAPVFRRSVEEVRHGQAPVFRRSVEEVRIELERALGVLEKEVSWVPSRERESRYESDDGESLILGEWGRRSSGMMYVQRAPTSTGPPRDI